MFTRCPQCDHIFSVSADQLRVAQGDVRCGSCARIFNAIESLTDEPPTPPPAATTAVPPPATGAQSPADSSAATRYGHPGPEDDFEPEPEVPALEASDDNADAEPSLEFDAPEQDWSNFFIDAAPGTPPAVDLIRPGRIEPQLGDDEDQQGDVVLDGDLEAITADPEEWRAFIAEMDPAPGWQSTATDPPQTEDPAGAEDSDSAEYADDDSDDVLHERDAWDEADDAAPVFVVDQQSGETSATAETEDEHRFDADDGDDELDDESIDDPIEFEEDEAETPDALDDLEILPAGWTADSTPPPTSSRWTIAAVGLALALGLQLLHYNRDGLATDPRFGAQLQEAYALVGKPLIPEWPLAAYSIRRSEALAGGSAQEALDITAAIEVSSDTAVGLPLIRVSLRDQWSNVIASRVFEPDEYLADARPPIVTGGTLIPVAVSVIDPGTEARGYEVDVCLQRRAAGLICQQAPGPFAP